MHKTLIIQIKKCIFPSSVIDEISRSNTSVPSVEIKKIPSSHDFVWINLSRNNYWPALTISASDCHQESVKNGHSWVLWLGDHKISEIEEENMMPFMPCFSTMYKTSKNFSTKLRSRAIAETIETLAKISNIVIDNEDGLMKWALAGFPGFRQQNNNVIKILLDTYLNPDETIAEKQSQQRENGYEGESVINLADKMETENLNIEDICISCWGKSEALDFHPLFNASLCKNSCRLEYKTNFFIIGDDGKHMCCVICCKAGKLIVCSEENCPRAFCERCLKSIMDEESYNKEIEQDVEWYCFFCSDDPVNKSILQIRKLWNVHLLKLLSDNKFNIQFTDFENKRPIVVLSLFDGISTGKVVLDKLGIVVGEYYASEVNEDAIRVSKIRHGSSITHLGDVKDLTREKIEALPKIDLVLAGSPCVDFSLVNPARKGIDNSKSASLFKEYLNILRYVRQLNNNVFYLFENVCPMQREAFDFIKSSFDELLLEKEPSMIDAKYFSPQKRNRYFWGNIPGLQGIPQFWNNLPPEIMEKYHLQNYLAPNLGRKAMVSCIRTVTTSSNSLVQKDGMLPVTENGKPAQLMISELEKIFGFPESYTDASINLQGRQALLGRAWSVPVVQTILQPLRFFFKCK